jgi:hypothetical protein
MRATPAASFGKRSGAQAEEIPPERHRSHGQGVGAAEVESGGDVGGSDVGGADVGGSDVGGADVGGADEGGEDAGGDDDPGGGKDRRDDPRRITVAFAGANATAAVHDPPGASARTTVIVSVTDSPGCSTPDVADSRSHPACVDADHRTSAEPLAVSVTSVRPAAGTAATRR